MAFTTTGGTARTEGSDRLTLLSLFIYRNKCVIYQVQLINLCGNRIDEKEEDKLNENVNN